VCQVGFGHGNAVQSDIEQQIACYKLRDCVLHVCRLLQAGDVIMIKLNSK